VGAEGNFEVSPIACRSGPALAVACRNVKLRRCSRMVAHAASGGRLPLMAASHPNNFSMGQQPPVLTGTALTHEVGVHEAYRRMLGQAAAGFLLASHLAA
jgi:hypothetical protein